MRLSKALLALWLAVGVSAEVQSMDWKCPIDLIFLVNAKVLAADNCAALHDAAQAQSTTEVVVWVDEHGEQERVETNAAPEKVSPLTCSCEME